jgi:hypothetical protein
MKGDGSMPFYDVSASFRVTGWETRCTRVEAESAQEARDLVHDGPDSFDWDSGGYESDDSDFRGIVSVEEDESAGAIHSSPVPVAVPPFGVDDTPHDEDGRW